MFSAGSVCIYETFSQLPAVGSGLGFAQDTNQFYQWVSGAWAAVPPVGATRVVSSVGGSATPTINVSTTDLYEVTALAQAITGVTVTGTPTDGQVLKFRFKDNAVAKAITYGASFTASGATALLTTTIASKTHMQNFQYDSTLAKFVATYVDVAGY
jgi:hypothetical protein